MSVQYLASSAMDGEEEGEEACLPCCDTWELCPTSPGTTLDITRSLAAYTPRDAVWSWNEYKVLRVRFLNPQFMRDKKWTVGNGESMNTINILDWANTWSKKGGGEIPSFVEAKPGEPAEIRVKFNNRGHNNSRVGTQAKSELVDQPTMNLDLQSCDTKYKRHLVIHEFGHALGLGHEHQRSSFWSDIRPFINQAQMKKYFRRCMRGLSDRDFEIHWEQNYAEDTCSELGQKTEYDPDSIMHYWFRKEWLHPPYNNRHHVTQCQLQQTLTDGQANALLGVHKRDGNLANEPSALDIKLMREVYGGGGDERDGLGRLSLSSFGGRSSISSCGGASSVGRNSLGGRSSLGGASSHSDSGLSLRLLAGAGNPNDWYDGEVENRHMTRIEYIDSNGEEKVLQIYDKAAIEWKKIAGNLGLEKGEIKSIKRNTDDEYDRVTEVLGQWMQNAGNLPNSKKYPKTWKALVELLNNSNLADLSSKLTEALSASVSSLRENFEY